MTGTTEKKTPPRNDQEWARDIQQRVENTEHPDALRAGAWTITTSDNGNLMACHVSGGCVTLAAIPPAGQDPDTITDEGEIPTIHVQRVADQTMPAGAVTPVEFDATEHAIGDWGIAGRSDGSPGGNTSQVVVPRAGVYGLIGTVVKKNATTGGLAIALRINGAIRAISSLAPENHLFPVTSTLDLPAGAAIDLVVSSGTTTVIGELDGATPGLHVWLIRATDTFSTESTPATE